MSRITEPTAGRVSLRGRVASLLEVGTGFHPELTGRENIFLNGAILGMSRTEIRRKFDEIIAFAEIERFLDTPVKRYSSGMFVRLAFAVAAHLEPEVLVVDEVLAVGDNEFQKKCLGRMGEVSKGGRTVLFVSHDMRNVTALCNRGILLERGRIERQGPMSSVADTYLKNRVNAGPFADLRQRGERSGSGDAQFRSIELLKEGHACRTFAYGEDFALDIEVHIKKPIGVAILQAMIVTDDGVRVHEFVNANDQCRWAKDVGIWACRVTVPKLLIYPGTYSVDLWLGDRNSQRIDYITNAISFDVIQPADSDVVRLLDRSNGLVFQHADWSFKEIGANNSQAIRGYA